MNFSFLTEYITGDRFRSAANVAFDIDPTRTAQKISLNAERIWCKTDYVHELFARLQNRQKPCVIITHNSDYEVDEALFAKRPYCIWRWFAQNVNYDHPILIPIPIGCENLKSPRGYSGDMSVLDRLLQRAPERRHLALLNINPQTNSKERQQVINVFSDKTWVLHSPFPCPFPHTMQLTRESKFVFCPRGNGIDTHRVWESLYLGAIPIVKRGVHFQGFQDLPILMVNEWWDVTEDLLEDEYRRISRMEFNYDKLKISYWKGLVKTCLSEQ